MKKILSALLILCMMISLCCGCAVTNIVKTESEQSDTSDTATKQMSSDETDSNQDPSFRTDKEDTVYATGEISPLARFTIRDEAGTVYIDNRHIESVTAQHQKANDSYGMLFILNDEGTSIFAQVTENNIGRPLPIYLNDQLLCEPTVADTITDGKMILSFNDYDSLMEFYDLITK